MLIGPQISSTDAAVATNVRAVRGQIVAASAATGRTEDSITLVAVSKGHSAPSVRAVASLGICDFGESYLQEALPKRASLGDLELTWHFIGRLQANKTRPIAEHFDWVHGVDRLRIAERLSVHRPHHAPPLKVCIQVNIADEATKAGIAPALVPGLAVAVSALPRLQLRGLMCILPTGLSVSGRRHAFGTMHALLQQIDAGRGRFDTLSMGMSTDFQEAILEGSTLVRIGTAIFGARPDTDSSAQPGAELG